jgi:virulence factor
MVGLGDIAGKAYLPLLGADRDVDLVLVTRDPQVRRKVSAQWRTAASYPRIEDALAAYETIDAALVHSATAAHPALTRTLLSAGVPTMVDKPLASSGAEATELVNLARTKGVSLAVAFNRRFAPAYAQLATQSGLDTVVLTKNRIDWADDPRQVVFDDFVHVIDTLRFLVTPEPDQVLVSARPTAAGTLGRIAVTLTQGNRMGVGIMDRDSGQVTEFLDAMGPRRAVRISDLTDVTIHEDGQTVVENRDGWSPVAVQRGFTAMVAGFLDSVRQGEVLDAGDAAKTHDLCEQVVQAALGVLPEPG